MIPFNRDIKTLDDVKAAYPKSFDMDLLTNKQVKIFEKEILQELIDDEIGMCELRDEICPSVTSLRKRFAPVAQAKAAYKLLWCGVHLGDQMLKYHWELKDMWTLIRRMQKAGQDPFSTEADTAAEFIESLKYYGRKRVVTKSGDEFFVYNPKGYSGDETKIQKVKPVSTYNECMAAEDKIKSEYGEKEVWKEIEGFHGYEISNLGRIISYKSDKPFLLQQVKTRTGYLTVNLSEKGEQGIKGVHRLVAEAFIPNPKGKPQINHINGLKTDNNVYNLEWVTATENMKHAYRTGLIKKSSTKRKQKQYTN